MARSRRSLKRAQSLFARWRRCRRRGKERIPDKLWDAATKAASEHGVACVAQRLSLSYTELKRRSLPNQNLPSPIVHKDSFVEIPLIPEVLSHGHDPVIVEITSPHGFRMCVRPAHDGVVDVVGVIRSFMGVKQ